MDKSLGTSTDLRVSNLLYAAGAGAALPESRHDRQSDDSSRGPAATDATAFKNKLHSCLDLLRQLIDEMVRWIKEVESAGQYLKPIIIQLDNKLVRLEIWAADIGIEDPGLGEPSKIADVDLVLTRFVTTILEGLIARLREIERKLQDMRSIIEKLSGNRFNDLKFDAQLQALMRNLERECEQIALAVRSLIDLTDALRMEQAINFQRGPLAGLRKEILHQRSQTTKLVPQVPTNDPLSSPLETSASDQDPWARKMLLTIDGGGTRCLSSIMVLKALMKEITFQEQASTPKASSSASPLDLMPRNPQRQTSETSHGDDTDLANYLPCHYFDCIVGTSFGGLIAMMLGRLRMDVDQCYEIFLGLLDADWSHRQRVKLELARFRIIGKSKSKSKAQVLMESSETARILTSNSHKLNDAFLQPNEHACRTIVIAKPLSALTVKDNVCLFRSYRPPTRNRISQATMDDVAIIDRLENRGQTFSIGAIARAITVGISVNEPTPLEVGTEKYRLIDGSSRAYNPSFLAFSDIADTGPATFLLSIGTGRDFDKPVLRYLNFSKLNYTRNALNMSRRVVPDDSAHKALKNLQQLGRLEYQRMEVRSGIERMNMYEWEGPYGSKTIERIRNATQQLLADPKVKEDITKLASMLIKTRRARALSPDLDRWRKFCDQD